MFRGGVYLYRARKPGARYNIPILSRHFAYAGETNSFHHRHLQHTVGGGTYNAVAKPWADLDPVCVLRIPLPDWKWLRLSVETVLIVLTWPVYNHKKNLWNPRRIPLSVAHRQRMARDRGRHPVNLRPVHLFVLLVSLVAALVVWHW